MPGYVERAYLHDGNDAKGTMSVLYSTRLNPGEWEIRLSFPTNRNRATNVPVVLRCDGRKYEFSVNQRESRKGNSLFTAVGQIRLAGNVTVEISNDGTNGYVIADAVQFVPAKPE